MCVCVCERERSDKLLLVPGEQGVQSDAMLFGCDPAEHLLHSLAPSPDTEAKSNQSASKGNELGEREREKKKKKKNKWVGMGGWRT